MGDEHEGDDEDEEEARPKQKGPNSLKSCREFLTHRSQQGWKCQGGNRRQKGATVIASLSCGTAIEAGVESLRQYSNMALTSKLRLAVYPKL